MNKFILLMESSREELLLEQAKHNPELLNEWVADMAANAGHLALDVAGFVPGIGELADFANAILYFRKTPPDYLLGGLSAIACLPVLGDVVGKGGKLAIWAARTARTFPRTTEVGARALKVLQQIKQFLEKNWKKVDWFLQQLETPPKEGEDYFAVLRPYIPKAREALQEFFSDKGAMSKLAAKRDVRNRVRSAMA